MNRWRCVRLLVLASLLAARTVPLSATEPHTDRYGDPLPAGAVERLGSIRFLHGDWICNLTFSPDGKTLVSGTHEPFFRVWDAATGRELRRFEVKDTTVVRVALSPDGRLVASSANGGPLTIWETATGKPIVSRPLDAGLSYDAGLAWSPDGKILALALQDGLIRFLNPTTGKVVRTCEHAPKTRICGIVFSPDGKLLLSAGFFQQCSCVWDAATGKLLRKLEGNADMGGCLAFSPDGKMVAGDCSYSIGPGSTRSTFRLWDVANGKKIRDLPAWAVHCAAFSPDGKLVAVGGAERLIQLIDPATGKVVREWRAHADRVSALAFSRDGKILASGGADKRIHLWDPATGKELHPVPGHCGAVQKVVFTPNGRTIVSGSRDRTIRFWDSPSGREWARGEDIGDSWGVDELVCSPDGTRLASLEIVRDTKDNVFREVRLWDTSRGKMILRQLTKESDQVWAIAFLPDNQSLAVAFGNGILGLWQPTTGKVLRRLGKSDVGIASLLVSPDGKSIAWANNKQYVGIRDLDTGVDRHTFKNAAYDLHTILAFSPDASYLATADHNDPICVWDVVTGKQLFKLERDDLDGTDSIRGIAFSPDGSLIATTRFDEVRLWDLHTRKEFRRLRGHQGYVNAVAFAPDGRTLVSASDDGTLLIWDMTGRLREGRLPAITLKPEELEQQWKTLGETDPETRWRAIWTLAACPQAASFLSTKVRPIPIVSAERLKQLIADLDDDAFSVREKASRQLAQIGEVAGPSLQEARISRPSVEASRRITALLKPLTKLDSLPLSAERLRAGSTLTVLEYLSDKEATNLLKALAHGAPQARQTREAKAALWRLSKRTASHP